MTPERWQQAKLILADAAETKICVLLSISTLLGLGLFAVSGAAWLDPVAGFQNFNNLRLERSLSSFEVQASSPIPK